MNEKLSKEEVQRILRKYLSGECTDKEKEAINRWYASFDRNAKNEENVLTARKDEALKLEMLKSISRQLDEHDNMHRKSEAGSPVRGLAFYNIENLARIAAVLLMAVAFAVFFYAGHLGLEDRKELAYPADSSESLRTVTAGGASAAVIYLSDGSVVWLKGESFLEYPETFGEGKREVKLSGEAFFDVAKDQERPFIIHASNITTRVLGTSFNIKAYGHEQSHEVVVVTGKVAVSVRAAAPNSAKELVLSANQKAIYSKQDNSLVEADAAEAASLNALRKSKLVFEDVPLKDILKVLSVTHDVQIAVGNDNMKHCLVTADLTGEDLEVSLTVLATTINATYAINGKHVVLAGDGCGIPSTKTP